MKRLIIKLHVFIISVLAAHSYALTITEADAFSQGDKLAFHQYDANLDWLDLDVTGSQNFTQITAELNTTYLGWRLPTEAEVLSLLSGLFNTNFSNQSSGVHWNEVLFTDEITTHSFFPELEAALSMMRSDNPVMYSNSGTQYFRQDNLYLDDTGAITQMELVLYTNLYNLPPESRFQYYYETEAFGFPDATPTEIRQGSVLLVKDVPEPSSMMLIVFGLGMMWLRREKLFNR